MKKKDVNILHWNFEDWLRATFGTLLVTFILLGVLLIWAKNEVLSNMFLTNLLLLVPCVLCVCGFVELEKKEAEELKRDLEIQKGIQEGIREYLDIEYTKKMTRELLKEKVR